MCHPRNLAAILTLKQVSNLEEVLSKQYNYRVFKTQLDITLPTRPQVLINYEVANFVKEQDAEDTLLILYYAGHGTPGRSPGQLRLFGQVMTLIWLCYTFVNFYRQSNEESTDNIVWNFTEASLQDTYADVLEIFDCCYAGDLGRAGRTTRSVFL
jgi:Caspase domain